MQIDEAELIKHYNLCNPFKSYPPDSPYNIDIDNQYDDENKLIDARGRKWADYLAKKVRFSVEEPACLFFSGHRGSGKTTELKRVQNRLENDGYRVVYIDCEEFISLTHPIDIIDILSVITHNTIKAVEGEEALKRGFFERVIEFLKRDVALQQVQAGIEGNKFVFELKESNSLSEIIRQSLSRTFLDFKQQVNTELERLNTKVKDQGKKGIVVIFDTLEKLRGLTSNWQEVIQSAETVFGGESEHLRLPLHVIYTVPTSFALRERGDTSVEFLPVLKVIDKQDNPYNKGIELAKKIVYSRLNDTFCKDVFGASYDSFIEELVVFSGGYPRDLLQMVQKVLLLDDFPVTQEALKKIKAEYTNEYKDIIAKDYDAILKEVSTTNTLHTTRDDHYLAERLFATHVILRYSNNDSWYALHPAIKGLYTTNASD